MTTASTMRSIGELSRSDLSCTIPREGCFHTSNRHTIELHGFRDALDKETERIAVLSRSIQVRSQCELHMSLLIPVSTCVPAAMLRSFTATHMYIAGPSSSTYQRPGGVACGLLVQPVSCTADCTSPQSAPPSPARSSTQR